MKAIFDKLTPTEEGATITLKKKCTKDEIKSLVRETADFYGEEVNVGIIPNSEPNPDDMPDYMKEIHRIIEVVRNQAVLQYIEENAERIMNVVTTPLDTESINTDSSTIIHESSERQELVTEAHDKIEDNKGPYAPDTDRY